jgi:hypothetical protein
MHITGRDLLMKDKKAAKLIIKRAKEHPKWYTKEEVRFAKILKKRLKLEKKQHEREVGDSDPRSGTDDGVRGEGKQPEEPRQSKRQWFIKLLHKARTLVRL